MRIRQDLWVIFVMFFAFTGAVAGQELVFGTHAGMSIQEVLASVPGSEQIVHPGPSGNFPPEVVFHVRLRTTVAGVPLYVSFGFTEGTLRHVEVVISSESGDHEQHVFAVRRLLQAFIDHFGPPLSKEERLAPKIPPMFMDDINSFKAEWYRSAVSVRLAIVVLNGGITGTVFISHLPSGL